MQQKKAERIAKLGSEGTPSEISSGPPSLPDTDGGASLHSESFVHTSQMGQSALKTGAVGADTQAKPSSKKSKAQLWNELKISSITRAFTLLYTLALLTLLTRIQLNLLGRRNYLSSVVSMAAHSSDESTISLENHDDDNLEQTFGNDFETNRQYLTFSWWLLHKGWRDIMGKVEKSVKEVFGPLSPREEITLEKLSHLTLEVRKRIEGATEQERRLDYPWNSCNIMLTLFLGPING
jgi:peroxin-3